MSLGTIYQFGAFRLDAAARTLTADERLVLLTPKAVETLRVLVDRHPRVVTRDELLQTVWNGRWVEEGVISVNVALLRRALSDAGLTNAIETVPKRGYRFLPAVTRVASAGSRSGRAAVSRRLYLEGRYFWSRRTEAMLAKAAACFEQAAEQDPHCALAYAGLADTHLGIGILSPRDAMSRAKVSALRAIELDPAMGEAYASLGRVRMAFEWDWVGAGEAFARAIALSPEYVTGHQWLANWLAAVGRTPEALDRIRHAQSLDPVSLNVSAAVGFVSYMARRFDDAAREYRRVIDMDTTFVLAHRELSMALGQMRRHAEALTSIEAARTLAPADPLTAACHAHALALAGDHGRALDEVNHLTPQATHHHRLSQIIAAVFVALGNRDEGMRWLARAADARSYTLIWLKVDPWFDAVRHDARFVSILQRIWRSESAESVRPC